MEDLQAFGHVQIKLVVLNENANTLDYLSYYLEILKSPDKYKTIF